MRGDREPPIFEVGVSCDHCHRTVTFSVDELEDRTGRHRRPVEVAMRMRCTGCGRKSLTPAMRIR